MVSASLTAFRRRVTVDWPKRADEDARQKLVQVAAAGHARIMADQLARSGMTPQFEVYANAPGNANLASVKLPGPIVYLYRYFAEVVEFALDELHKASPVQSGDYVRSHLLFVNGMEVARLPHRLSSDDVIMISNPVPYARRLEIGKTKSGRDFVLQVPNRIYERVAKQKVIPKYRNVAKVTFQYVTLESAHTIKGGLSPSYATGGVRKVTQNHSGTVYGKGSLKMRKRRQKVGDKVQAPAITIRALT